MPPLVLDITINAQGLPVLKQVTDSVQHLGQQVTQQGGAFQQASKGSDAFTGSLLGAGKASDSLGMSLLGTLKTGAGFALGFAGVSTIGGALIAAAGSAASFEAAMANVNTLGIRSIATQQMLREQVLQLPPVLGSSTELAKGLYEVLSSGVEPAKAIAFLEQSALLARAGLAQLDTATIALTKTMAAYRLPVEDAAKVSDILFKAVEVGQGSLQQFAGAFPQVTQLSASMGVSFADTANAMATLTQTFRNADTAATGYRSMLQQLIQNNEKFLALGINIKQVISEQGLLGAVKVLQQVSQGSSERLRVFINDIEGFNAALALTGPQFATLVQNQQKFKDATGSVADAVKEQTKTATAAWESFTTSVGKLVADVSPPLLAAFTTITQGAGQFVESVRVAIRGIPEEVKAAKIDLDKLAPDFVKTIQTLLAIPTGSGPFLKTIQEQHAELLRLKTAQQGATETQNLWNTAVARANQELTKALIPYTEWRDESIRAAEATKVNELAIQNANTAITQLDAALKALKPGELPKVISAGELQLHLNAAEASMRSLIGSFHNGLIPLQELKTAGETAAKVMAARFGEVPDTMKRLLIEVRALTDTTGNVESAITTSFRRVTAVRDEETGKIIKIVQGENAAIVRLYDESGKLIGGAMQRGIESAAGSVVKSAEATGQQAAGGFTKGLTSVPLDPARQALLDTFTQVYDAVQLWKRGLLELDPATAHAAAAMGILSRSAAEAGTAIAQSSAQTQNAKKTFEFWGVEVETVESKAGKLTETVQNLGFTIGGMAGAVGMWVANTPVVFEDMADSVEGVQRQIHLLQMALVNFTSDSMRADSFLTSAQLMQEVRIMGMLQDKLLELTAQGEESSAHLQTVYDVLGTHSSQALKQMADAAVAAFNLASMSGTSTAEHLQDIWVNTVLPKIIDAYGETSRQALDAMRKYGDAVTDQAQQTFGVITQVAQNTVQVVHNVATQFGEAMEDGFHQATEAVAAFGDAIMALPGGTPFPAFPGFPTTPPPGAPLFPLIPMTRQHGGPGFPMQPLWVGERGPELIVPRAPVTVVPAPAPGRQGASIVIQNLTITMPQITAPAGGAPMNRLQANATVRAMIDALQEAIDRGELRT